MSLNAAVMTPDSGVQDSLINVRAAGISNFSRPLFRPAKKKKNSKIDKIKRC